MQKPTLYIYRSLSNKAYMASIAFVPAIITGVLPYEYPTLAILFGFVLGPFGILLAYFGIKILLRGGLRNNKFGLALSREGLQIPSQNKIICWNDIADVSISSYSKFNLSYLNVHLTDESLYPVPDEIGFLARLDMRLGLRSKASFYISDLAILPGDLVALIKDYKANSDAINDRLTEKKTDKNMARGLVLLNWGLSVSLWAMLVLAF